MELVAIGSLWTSLDRMPAIDKCPGYDPAHARCEFPYFRLDFICCVADVATATILLPEMKPESRDRSREKGSSLLCDLVKCRWRIDTDHSPISSSTFCLSAETSQLGFPTI